jgi:hypothetical protein
MNNERIARGSVLSIVAELDKRDAEIERLRELLLKASGPMSYGRWSTDFRNEVKEALGDE